MTLSPLTSRIVAWGLLANVCWMIGRLLVLPLLIQVGDDREAITRSQQLLARYRQLEASLPSTQAQLAELRGRAGSNRYLLTSSSSSQMAAEMQNAVQRLISDGGATLRSSRTVAPSVEKGFDRLGVDLEITASNASLATLLRAVALAEPVILVERMLVQVPENGTTPITSDGQPSLAITLRLVSYGRSASTGTKL